MVHHNWVRATFPVAAVNAMDHRAYVQTVSQGRGHHLEELTGKLGQLVPGIPAIAAPEASEPSQKRCRG